MHTNMPTDMAGKPATMSHGRYAYPVNSPNTAIAATGAIIATAPVVHPGEA